MKLWFRVEADASTDTKIAQLAAAVDVRVPHAFGLVVGVWCGVARHADTGDLTGIADASLETWAGWHGKKGRFAAEFRRLFMDGDCALHGWAARQGKLIAVMEKDRARHRKQYADSQKNHDGFSVENPGSFCGISERNTITPTRQDSETGSSGGPPDNSVVSEIQPPSDPGGIAILLTSAANQGIAARYGEQPTPLVWSSPSTADVVSAIAASQIPVMFARDAIYSAAVKCPQDRAPRGLKYFLPQVVRAWSEEQARLQAHQSPTPNVIALHAGDRKISDLSATKRALLKGTGVSA